MSKYGINATYDLKEDEDGGWILYVIINGDADVACSYEEKPTEKEMFLEFLNELERYIEYAREENNL